VSPEFATWNISRLPEAEWESPGIPDQERRKDSIDHQAETRTYCYFEKFTGKLITGVCFDTAHIFKRLSIAVILLLFTLKKMVYSLQTLLFFCEQIWRSGEVIVISVHYIYYCLCSKRHVQVCNFGIGLS